MVKWRYNPSKKTKKKAREWGDSFIIQKRDPIDLGFEAPRKKSLKAIDHMERLY